MRTTEIPTSIDAFTARKSQQNTHIVQFHAEDEFLIDDIARMIGSALVFGDAAVVVAAASRRAQLENQLKISGTEIGDSVVRGWLYAAQRNSHNARDGERI